MDFNSKSNTATILLHSAVLCVPAPLSCWLGGDALLGEHMWFRAVKPMEWFWQLKPDCELKFSSSWAHVVLV